MNKKLKRDLLVFAIIFGVLTIPFLFTNIDISLQKPYYTKVDGWFLMKIPFWDFLYKYSIFLGYLAAVVALVVVSVSYWKRSLIKWRKAAYFMLLVVVLGPGVLVNATFKDHWGRPRPREITQFDGKEQFVKPWVKADTKGKSFPCGHASIAFYLAVPFLFLRKNHRKLAWFFLVFGSLYGLLVGYARMIAGGHFASDVLWAAGMVWFAAILSFYWLKVDKEIDLNAIDEAAQKRKGKIVAALMGVVLPIITIGLLLATPYISTRTFTKDRATINNLNMQCLLLNIDEGPVNINFINDFEISNSVSAFGFPNSKLGWSWIEGDTTKFGYTYIGWFTEVRNDIRFSCPINTTWSNKLVLKEGNVYLEISNDTIPKNIDIEIQQGDIFCIVNAKENISENADIFELQDFSKRVANLSLNLKLGNGKVVIQKQ